MVVTYFPELYPDETLYSLVARFRRHTGGHDVRVAMEALFGAPERNMSVEMPSGLEEFARRSGRQLSATSLAMRHTSLPYYTAYKDDARRQAVLAQMLGEGTPGAAAGMGSTPSFTKRTLHHCKPCFDEMVERHGEPYWRRDHQLPSVLLCPKHGVPLIDSGIPRASTIKAIEPAASCPENAPEIVIEATALPILTRLAAKSSALLRGVHKEPSFALTSAELDQLLRRKGFVLRNATIDVTGLSLELYPYFAVLRPYWPGLAYAIDDAAPWVIHGHGTRFSTQHTIKHLVLRDALQQLPDRTATPKRRHDDGLFGPGPWPCLNPLADHVGQMTITAVERYYGTHQHEGGRFTCSCGYIYVRLKRRTGEIGPPKRKSFGPLMEDLVRRGADQGWSLNATAKKVHMKADSLFIYLERNGIEHPWRNERLMKLPIGRRRPKPQGGRDQSKRRKRKSVAAPKRLIDENYSKRIRELAEQIQGRIPEQRVTRSRLQKEIGYHPSFGAERMPLTTAAFEECCETTERFRLRRLHNILDAIGSDRRPTFAQLGAMCWASSRPAARWAERMVADYDKQRGNVEMKANFFPAFPLNEAV